MYTIYMKKKLIKCRNCPYQSDPLKEGNPAKRKCGKIMKLNLIVKQVGSISNIVIIETQN